MAMTKCRYCKRYYWTGKEIAGLKGFCNAAHKEAHQAEEAERATKQLAKLLSKAAHG